MGAGRAGAIRHLDERLTQRELCFLETGFGGAEAGFGCLNAGGRCLGFRLGLVALGAKAALALEVNLCFQADQAGIAGRFRLGKRSLRHADAVCGFFDLELNPVVFQGGQHFAFGHDVVDTGSKCPEDARHFRAHNQDFRRFDDAGRADDIDHCALLDVGEGEVLFRKRVAVREMEPKENAGEGGGGERQEEQDLFHNREYYRNAIRHCIVLAGPTILRPP